MVLEIGLKSGLRKSGTLVLCQVCLLMNKLFISLSSAIVMILVGFFIFFINWLNGYETHIVNLEQKTFQKVRKKECMKAKGRFSL